MFRKLYLTDVINNTNTNTNTNTNIAPSTSISIIADANQIPIAVTLTQQSSIDNIITSKITATNIVAKEIISDNENGFLFKTENVSDLTAKLNSILSNEELMEQIRTKGTKLINTNYDWCEIGRQTKQVYQSL